MYLQSKIIVSTDEYQHRLHGFINLNYVGEKFAPNIIKKLRKIKITLNLMNMQYYYGGSLHNASIGFRILFGIQDKKINFYLNIT